MFLWEDFHLFALFNFLRVELFLGGMRECIVDNFWKKFADDIFAFVFYQ